MSISEDNERVRKVIQLMCRNDPITGLFPFSILDPNERKSIVHLSHGESAKEETINMIYRKMYTLDQVNTTIRRHNRTYYITPNCCIIIKENNDSNIFPI